MGPAILGSVSTVGHCFFDTAIGSCAIAWSDRGIVALQLPERDDAATLARIRRPAGSELAPPDFVAQAIDGIRRVLAGDDDDLQWARLDLDGTTDFDREVYAATRAIGPGRTRSYGEVAASVVSRAPHRPSDSLWDATRFRSLSPATGCLPPIAVCTASPPTAA